MMRPFGRLLYEFDVVLAGGRVMHPLGTPGARQSCAAFASVEAVGTIRTAAPAAKIAKVANVSQRMVHPLLP